MNLSLQSGSGTTESNIEIRLSRSARSWGLSSRFHSRLQSQLDPSQKPKEAIEARWLLHIRKSRGKRILRGDEPNQMSSQNAVIRPSPTHFLTVDLARLLVQGCRRMEEQMYLHGPTLLGIEKPVIDVNWEQPYLSLMTLCQSAFGSLKYLHHHLKRKAKSLCKRLPTPSPPRHFGSSIKLHATKGNDFFPESAHQKNYL